MLSAGDAYDAVLSLCAAVVDSVVMVAILSNGNSCDEMECDEDVATQVGQSG